MRYLTLADHFSVQPSQWPDLLDDNVGAIISCGDLAQSYLARAAAQGVPLFGVYGNHCKHGYLRSIPDATDLHGGHVTLLPGGIRAVGVEGCVRYKDDTDDVLYTQDEYARILSTYPTAGIDMVITHCPPRGINDHDDDAHVGIDALRDYVEQAQPAWLIHGHTYPDSPVTRWGATTVVYVHGHHTISV